MKFKVKYNIERIEKEQSEVDLLTGKKKGLKMRVNEQMAKESDIIEEAMLIGITFDEKHAEMLKKEETNKEELQSWQKQTSVV